MGKKGKKAQAGRPKKVTPKDISKKLDAMVKKLEEELKGADLFAPLPPTEDCPICLLPLSRVPDMSSYMGCCGKVLCMGCGRENWLRTEKRNARKEDQEAQGGLPCPFCRTPEVPGKMRMRQYEAKAAQNDANACCAAAFAYARGVFEEVPPDEMKAIDYWIKAIELGSANACSNIATYYHKGGLLPIDQERKALLDRVGALRGCIIARHNIAGVEYISGNHELAVRHWKIAAEGGSQISLNQLKKTYNGDQPGKEFISKDDLDRAFRICHKIQEEVKSEDREKHRDDTAGAELASRMKC